MHTSTGSCDVHTKKGRTLGHAHTGMGWTLGQAPHWIMYIPWDPRRDEHWDMHLTRRWTSHIDLTRCCLDRCTHCSVMLSESFSFLTSVRLYVEIASTKLIMECIIILLAQS